MDGERIKSLGPTPKRPCLSCKGSGGKLHRGLFSDITTVVDCRECDGRGFLPWYRRISDTVSRFTKYFAPVWCGHEFSTPCSRCHSFKRETQMVAGSVPQWGPHLTEYCGKCGKYRGGYIHNGVG